jgi:hypothetical protein
MAQPEVPAQTHVVVAEKLPIANDAFKAAEAFEIKNDQDSDFAAVMIREIKEQYEAIEAERKKISGPLHQAWTATNNFFRPVTTALLGAEGALKKKVAVYERAKREANMRALQVAAGDKKAFEKLELVSAHAPQGISIREVWKPEVTDESAVPREYCSPDLKKIGAATPGTVIPGVRWFQEDSVASRKK